MFPHDIISKHKWELIAWSFVLFLFVFHIIIKSDMFMLGTDLSLM